MNIIDIKKIIGTKIDLPFERTIKSIATKDNQDYLKDLSLTMGILYPHSKNDSHTHEVTEILYIVTGYGKAVLDGETYEIGPDTVIIARKGMVHQQINDSDETMKMFCIWNPAVTDDDVIGRALVAAEEARGK